VVPGLGFRSDVILPPSLYQWAQSLPEEDFSIRHAICDMYSVESSLGSKCYALDAWPNDLLKKPLLEQTDEIMKIMYDEMAFAIDAYLDITRDEWEEVSVEGFVRDIVFRTSSRFLVGLPLCRDEAYLGAARESISAYMLVASSLAVLPRLLLPAAGWIGRKYTTRVVNRLRRCWEPFYHTKPALLSKKSSTLTGGGGGSAIEPNDREPSGGEPNNRQHAPFLQLILRHAQRHRPTELLNIDSLTRRLSMVNFSAMHSTTITAINLLLDLIGSDTEDGTVEALRDEVYDVMGPDLTSDCWTRHNISKLRRADSLARETMRLRNYGSRITFRKVMAT
jgi:hypothetical protein